MSYNRRTVLTATGAVITAGLAGCSDNGNGNHESAVESYLDALEERDLEAYNEVVAADGELGEADSWPYHGTVELIVHDYELVEEDGDTVVYEAEVTSDHAQGETDIIRTIELRQEDGEWKIWDYDETLDE